MTIFWGVLAGLALAALIWMALSRFVGFDAQKPGDYAPGRLDMDPKRALSGKLLVDGVLYGPLGRVVSRFTADMNCDWDGDELTINEVFKYDSGTEQTRRWVLNLGPDAKLRGGAEDILGAEGQVVGDALSLRYRIKLPAAAGGYVLSVKDWMYALDNGTLVNRSQMRKFGFKVAELVASIRPAT